MTPREELVQDALAAPSDRREAALRVLRGEPTGDALAPEQSFIAKVIGANGEPSVEQPDLQLPHAATLTPEQEHWLAMQGKAQVLACRTGSCGE